MFTANIATSKTRITSMEGPRRASTPTPNSCSKRQVVAGIFSAALQHHHSQHSLWKNWFRRVVQIFLSVPGFTYCTTYAHNPLQSLARPHLPPTELLQFHYKQDRRRLLPVNRALSCCAFAPESEGSFILCQRHSTCFASRRS